MSAEGYETYLGYLAQEFVKTEAYKKINFEGESLDGEAKDYLDALTEFGWIDPANKILNHAELQVLLNPFPETHFDNWS